MENIVRKGEIVCNKQFLLFSQCFLSYTVLIFNFKCTLKCRLHFVSIWTSLKFWTSIKFCRLVNYIFWVKMRQFLVRAFDTPPPISVGSV